MNLPSPDGSGLRKALNLCSIFSAWEPAQTMDQYDVRIRSVGKRTLLHTYSRISGRILILLESATIKFPHNLELNLLVNRPIWVSFESCSLGRNLNNLIPRVGYLSL